jgi:hypothetical protein
MPRNWGMKKQCDVSVLPDGWCFVLMTEEEAEEDNGWYVVDQFGAHVMGPFADLTEARNAYGDALSWDD